ncbi:hypothetical protein DAMA08_039410 [Martiniozyma asiatica (nom. inval.)]|nr:hypothetical protein DAMA08_039410 [Martiniozyma asiatica]
MDEKSIISSSPRLKKKQSVYFESLDDTSCTKSASRPLPKLDTSPSTPATSEYQKYRQHLLNSPTRSGIINESPNLRFTYTSPSGDLERQRTTPSKSPVRSSPIRQALERAESSPIRSSQTFDSSFSTLESPSTRINSRRQIGSEISPFRQSTVPDLSPSKFTKSPFMLHNGKSFTDDSELSIIDNYSFDSKSDFFYNNSILELQDSPITPAANKFEHTYVSESPSPIRTLNILKNDVPEFNSLPIEMQVIVNSRPLDNEHIMKGFDNTDYVEFWNLSTEEGKSFKEWSKIEFERQNALFEIFQHFKKIRFNLRRIVKVYGPEFKRPIPKVKFTSEDYKKTFDVLEEFYAFVDKLVVKKLKPLYDNHLLVSDVEVLKYIKHWLKQLKQNYDYISGSIVYLSKLTSNAASKEYIAQIAVNDFDLSNRSAVSSNELFNSYFAKLFTSMQLLFLRLDDIYQKVHDDYRLTLTSQIQILVKGINNISDSASDLEKKISFNEKLQYKTEALWSRMECVDMFDQDRITKEPIDVEMKGALVWDNSKLALFDNYLVPLIIKNSTLGLFKREEYFLSNNPIPLQYLKYDYKIEGSHKVLTIFDSGKNLVYHFRKNNDVSAAILDKFVKSLNETKLEFWNSINNERSFKLINGSTFIYKCQNQKMVNLGLVPIDNDPVIKILKSGNVNDGIRVTAKVLSTEYFTRANTRGHYNRFCLIGTNNGLYMGKVNDSNTWRQVSPLKDIKNLFVYENEVLLMQSRENIYHVKLSMLLKCFQSNEIFNDFATIDDHMKNISDFYVGFQSDKKDNGDIYLITWKDKIANYIKLNDLLSSVNPIWSQFKSSNQILTFQTVYANNFAVGHYVDDQAILNIAKLGEFRYNALINFDVKDILKHEKPIAAFRYPNKTLQISEMLVVYTNFCARMKKAKGKYVQSSEDIVWFGTPCISSTFLVEEKLLVVVGDKSIELWQFYDDEKKSKLTGCVIGDEVRMLSKYGNKVTFSVMIGGKEYSEQVIMKLKSSKV